VDKERFPSENKPSLAEVKEYKVDVLCIARQPMQCLVSMQKQSLQFFHPCKYILIIIV